MTLRQRFPYVLLMSVGGGLLGLAAWLAWQDGQWVDLGFNATTAVLLLVAAAVLCLRRPGQWGPEWLARFELVAVVARGDAPAGYVMRCNRCDATVLPRAVRITLPRQVTYARTHTTLACEPRRATDPDDTRRLGGDRARRARLRP